MPARHPAVILLIFSVLLLANRPAMPQDNVLLVIIDGARYSETFGDPDREHIPVMHSLSHQGTVIDDFRNDGITYTSRAVPALWCGVWTDVRDTTWNNTDTQYTLSPSIFEYVRHDLALPQDEVVYVLKSLPSLWLPSFHPDFGPDYWPTFHSEGSTDEDVRDEAIDVLQTLHPRLTLVYLADVDHAGHSGDWDDYLDAIETADAIVGELWSFVQSDPVYADNTVMMVTNDHGRHDDNHGGFQGHGDGCEGCRHIMMFAIGPGIRQGVIETSETRTIPDFAVTACEILDVNPAWSTGDVMTELFTPAHTVDPTHYSGSNRGMATIRVQPNPFNNTAHVTVELDRPAYLQVDIVDILGRRVSTLTSGNAAAGRHTLVLSATTLPSGPCFVRSTVDGSIQTVQRITVLR